MIHNKKHIASNEEIIDIEHCPYKGHTYFIPKSTNSEFTVRVNDLKLSLDGQSISPGKDSARLFVKKSPSQNQECIELYISEADYSNPMGNDSISFYIYREGTELPVAQATQSIEEFSSLRLTFSPEHYLLQPGRYFLLGENASESSDNHFFDTIHGHLCFPFRILRAGEELMHLTFQKVVVSRPSSVIQGISYTSGALRITLISNKSSYIEGEGTELSIICYNQDWHLMARTDRYISGSQIPRSGLSLSLHSENIWMPGTYFAVVSHNREPYLLISFDYRGNETTECQCRPLMENENEYWMVKKLEPNMEKRWRHVREFQGLAHAKPHLVRLSRHNGFNRLCSLHHLDMLQSNTFATITASTPFHTKRLAFCLPHLLEFCTEKYKQIDCTEWVESISESDCAYLEERNNHTLTLYGISALLTPNGRRLLTKIEEAAKDETVFWSLILCGTREEVEQVFAYAPELAAYFPDDTRFDILPPTIAEMVFLMQQQIRQASFNLIPLSENALAVQISDSWQEICFWTKEDIEQFVSKGIVTRMKQRLQATYLPGKQPRQKELLTVRPEDIDIVSYLKSEAYRNLATDKTDTHIFDSSMTELNAMTGLHTLKEELTTVFYQVRFNEQRRQLGLPAETDGTHHMIFTGNPGTGKTTVAGMIGKIYHSLGLLSKGEVISTERSQLVGRYIGETEEKMSALLERAQGNVLFIDEAYTLCNSLDDRKDFGNHVIESLLTLLAKPHPDVLVILAGYADEMERMMQMNQGLKGRFPYKFHFDDYNAEELLQIGTNLLKRKNYILSDAAESLLKTAVADAVRQKDRYFGNARWINQFIVSGILPAMARRVIQNSAPASVEVYRTIEASDVEQATRKYVQPVSPHLIPRRKIGFTA